MSSNLLPLLILLLTIDISQCHLRRRAFDSQFHQLDYSDQKIDIAEVTAALKTNYLQRFEGEIKSQYQGIAYGKYLRPLVVMPVSFNDKSCPIPINVIFQVNTQSKVSSLTDETLKRLYDSCPQIKTSILGTYPAKIAGHEIQVMNSQNHHQPFSILGVDFICNQECSLYVDFFGDGKVQFKIKVKGSLVKGDKQKNNYQEL